MDVVLTPQMSHLYHSGGGNDTIVIGDEGQPYESQISAGMNVDAGETRPHSSSFCCLLPSHTEY